MQYQIQTSHSEMIPISDFQYLYDLARCSKCQMFTVLKATNKLYGASDDCCCIHEIDIPFLVNTDLMFRIDSIDKNTIFNYKNYFIPNKFNWVILSEFYWDMYNNGDIISEYDPNEDKYILLDKCTKLPIDQIHMFKYRYSNDVDRFAFDRQLDGYLNRRLTLGSPEYFYSIESNDDIRKAFDRKAIEGRVLCSMKNENISVLFYFYKGLFSLNKNDKLDLEIRFDIFQHNTFMATFNPKKKKNPLIFNTYGVPFQEHVHCMFINLA